MRAALGRPRLGVSAFGIRHRRWYPSYLRIEQLLQDSEPGIDPAGLAIAGLAVAIHPAQRTQPLAVRLAQRLHRLRKEELLAHDVPEIDRIVLVERHADVIGGYFPLPRSWFVRLWEKHQIERRVHRNRERLQAAAAVGLQRGPDTAGQADLLRVLADLRLELHGRDDPDFLVVEPEGVRRKNPDDLIDR